MLPSTFHGRWLRICGTGSSLSYSRVSDLKLEKDLSQWSREWERERDWAIWLEMRLLEPIVKLREIWGDCGVGNKRECEIENSNNEAQSGFSFGSELYPNTKPIRLIFKFWNVRCRIDCHVPLERISPLPYAVKKLFFFFLVKLFNWFFFSLNKSSNFK